MALILVVDDEPQVRDLIRDTLAPMDNWIVEAGDGITALRIARTFAPGLVIIDLHLGSEPEGLELCDIFRKNPKMAGVPILAISGHANPSEISTALTESGAVTFLDKPFTPTELANVATFLIAESKGALSRLLAAMGQNAITNEVHAGIKMGNSFTITKALLAGIELAKADFMGEEVVD